MMSHVTIHPHWDRVGCKIMGRYRWVSECHVCMGCPVDIPCASYCLMDSPLEDILLKYHRGQYWERGVGVNGKKSGIGGRSAREKYGRLAWRRMR